MRAAVRIITVLLKMFLDNNEAPCTKNVTLCTQTILVWPPLIHGRTDIPVFLLALKVMF